MTRPDPPAPDICRYCKCWHATRCGLCDECAEFRYGAAKEQRQPQGEPTDEHARNATQ